MIHTLFSNRLEDLADSLAVLLAVPTGHPLATQHVMVQHPGMGHWLNMRLAEHPQHRVAMNVDYPLPVAQMWSLIRGVLGDQRVPEHSPYEREVVAWRLYDLLASDKVTGDNAFTEPNRYWQQQAQRQQALRRFELAEEVADLFEQYLMYRPDWIQRWDRGEETHWQARLWRLLTADAPDHPVRLLRDAEQGLDRPQGVLPDVLFVFGINSVAPLWLDFMRALSDRASVDFYVFCLNPTNEYAGDLTTEKRAARLRARWLDAHDPEALALDGGNPLIGSLGQQGQMFIRQLTARSDHETQLYRHPLGENGAGGLLHRLQADLLELVDGRDGGGHAGADDRVEIVSAHSALREVQGLHDWLLHQFNDDPTLTPKDVLVMCPNVEDYAPFVEAVFARRFDDLAETVPPLPSSIADRTLRDADATVATFLDMLTLPDARFQVSQVLGWLQVDAVRERLGLSHDDLERIADWLDAAAVHWGLDAGHKSQWTGEGGSDRFTWSQGLERLLLGFAWGDQEAVVGDRLLLPQVEGGDAVVLGKLMAFIRELRDLTRDLRKPRSVGDWQAFLEERLRQALFAAGRDFDPAHDDLRACIREFGENARRAGLQGNLPLEVVRRVIENALATPARTGRQFLTGQITVCSMVPMRSIPFRVIAVLGLNDGEFPRQRPPLGFDLMAEDGPRAGDRSRRGDDRYLFLEALVSARDRLYLSYQGRDVRTNTEKQPSLVLGELMHYLDGCSGWSRGHVRELPLQPFSEANFSGDWPGFDAYWLALARRREPRQKVASLEEPEWPESVALEDLARALENPARHFARTRLQLYLDDAGDAMPDDAEPFDPDHLDRYRLQHAVIEGVLCGEPRAAERARQHFHLSGAAPEHPLVDDQLDEWQSQAELFTGCLQRAGAAGMTRQAVSVTEAGLTLEAELPVTSNGDLLFWRLASPRGRDWLRLWLYHLVANARQPAATQGCFRGKQTEQVRHIAFAPLEPAQARDHLGTWVRFWAASRCEPSPCHADLGVTMVADDYRPSQFAGLWNDEYQGRGVGRDAYMAWFWPHPPEQGALLDALQPLYGPMLQQAEIEDAPLEVADD